MYLSRLILNARSRQVQQDLRNAYDLHRTLCFAWADDGEALPPHERVLWRPDGEHPPALLVQSRAAPDWGRLLTRHPGYLETFQTTHLGADKLAALTRQGGIYRFRLRANPSVKKAGKRYGLYSAPAQANWLLRQAESAGVELLEFRIAGSERFRASKGSSTPRLTLCAATFEGHLRVTDPQRLRPALEGGVGHGKAFGLGLLSLAPAP
ncbi:CRISPR system Cascade subunit CasE [Deinobacterium chartae]|uniref:CRISPR system Cascade subunit CasE n=1 Tax=Deinobacterium chartae TaxID=521158 RepID=A0A841I6A8_9DEIO|nr:type I-E CRISPR-associated protein Cas6/Cse3/CasE [Deinobacterium chartae]MBB6100008.1 CRISPR system Cascade subunit CasE [Deinobacterium chartae]